MLGFQIQHLKKGTGSLPTGPAASNILLFETCLRKIWISPEGAVTDGELAVLRAEAAYEFLLQVIAGLHSPIFGETEILGQFKNFLAQQASRPEFAFFQPWARLLLEDVKTLRSVYFRGQGQHSYGSLLRKKLVPGEKLWVIGAGQLTEAMLPWLSEQSVTLWARDPQKTAGRFPGVAVTSLQNPPDAQATIMVAAPLADDELAKLLPAGQAWIDLREKAVSTRLPVPRVNLLDLYRESAEAQDQKSELKQAVLSRIQAMSRDRLNRAWFRPQGWEDMCAS